MVANVWEVMPRATKNAVGHCKTGKWAPIRQARQLRRRRSNFDGFLPAGVGFETSRSNLIWVCAVEPMLN